LADAEQVLAGLALAFSRVIDNSVISLENICRHLEMGSSPKRAAEEGGAEVNLAVLAATLVDVVDFYPVTFLPGLLGDLDFFRGRFRVVLCYGQGQANGTIGCLAVKGDEAPLPTFWVKALAMRALWSEGAASVNDQFPTSPPAIPDSRRRGGRVIGGVARHPGHPRWSGLQTTSYSRVG
jgi:hypothetical protein